MLAVRWKMLFNKLAFHAFCYSYPTLLELVVAHFVVTLVSAIVRKLALKEAERFGSNESAYLTCLCVARAQIPPNLSWAGYCARLHRFILKHSSKKVRIRMSCSKRCKANYLWEPQRVCVCVRALCAT